MTTQFSPITIGPLLALSTAPKPIEQLAPIVTSPHNVAFGATRAEGSILGAMALYSQQHRRPPCLSGG